MADMQAIAWSLFFTALQNRIQKKGSESKDGRLSIADIRHAVGRASIDVTDNKILQNEANVIAQTLVPFLAFINEQPTESREGVQDATAKTVAERNSTNERSSTE